MCAVRTSINAVHIGRSELKVIMGLIRGAVPVGFNHHKEEQDITLMPEKTFEYGVIEHQYSSALKQLGTLGGGNHFIEIQKGSDGKVWLMIHSGSRNLGYRVAKYYNDLAIKKNALWLSAVPKAQELAFLPIETAEAKGYLDEMKYCVEFAQANRSLMMERVKNAVQAIMGGVEFDEEINVPHNYAKFEHHFNKNVLVHRKGATMAYEEQLGIIPGSQGTASYIVKGLGNRDSFMSCSHGAGRKMGRKQAKRELSLKVEQKRLDDLGVIHSVRHTKDLDEAAGAYKDINTVIENQRDLVEVVVELKPLAVIKG